MGHPCVFSVHFHIIFTLCETNETAEIQIQMHEVERFTKDGQSQEILQMHEIMRSHELL